MHKGAQDFENRLAHFIIFDQLSNNSHTSCRNGSKELDTFPNLVILCSFQEFNQVYVILIRYVAVLLIS